jgi:hypothetical protein
MVSIGDKKPQATSLFGSSVQQQDKKVSDLKKEEITIKKDLFGSSGKNESPVKKVQ